MPYNKPLVSVIMPIYNGEKWLLTSLKSLVDQTFKNFEILLINDGSTDASEKICQSFAEQDTRAHYFYKKNGGVSSARNLGLEKARGNFVYFFDCDDMLAPDTLEFLVNLQEINNADIASCFFTAVSEQAIPAEFKNENKSETIINAADDKWENGEVFTRILKCKLFSRKVIGDIRFSEQIHYAEDDLFTTEVFINADKVIYSPAIKVFYYLHEESETHRIQLYSFFESYVLARRLIKEKICAATNDENIRVLVCRDYFTSIFALFRCAVRDGDKKQYEQLQQKYAKLLEEFLVEGKISIGKKWEYKTYIKSYIVARLIHARKL